MRYKSEFGFHTPDRTKETLQRVVKETSIDFYDSSWHNDLVDSIEYEYEADEYYKIFIPNAKETNEEKEMFAEYVLVTVDDETLFDNIEDLINYLNTIK